MSEINPLYVSQFGSLTGITHPVLPGRYNPGAFIASTPSRPTSQEMKKASDVFREAFRRIPDEWLVAVSTPLYAFCFLIWDWVDSIINVCCTERRDDFKATSRKIRSLKVSYDKFRACVIDRKLSKREDYIGGAIEESCEDTLRRFTRSVSLRLSENGIPQKDRMLSLAVLQVLAGLDAVDKYSDRLDREIVERWKSPKPVISRSFVQDEIPRLRPLLKSMISQKAIECCRHATALAVRDFVRCFIEIEEYVFNKERTETGKRILRQHEQQNLQKQ